MKKHLHRFVALILLVGAVTQLHAQGTAFTYQGRLTENGVPANGANDFTFTLYDSVNGGAPVGVSNVVNDLAVTNGLFTVALDFGAAFDGSARWLQIAVRPGASAGAYTNLTPRQAITTAPYALRALTAGSASSATTAVSVAADGVNNLALAADAVDGAKILNGSIASADLNASLLNGTFWTLGGNAGTIAGANFLGTTDNQPLEFKVNDTRVLRLEDNGDSSNDPDSTPDGAPNIIAGSSLNFVADGVVGATIAGGGATYWFGLALTNAVHSDFGTIGGGLANRIQAGSIHATISGGLANLVDSSAGLAAIGGGRGNKIQANDATIGGGYENLIQTDSAFSTIGGGWLNRVQSNAPLATIGGGQQNAILAAPLATINGGLANTIHSNAFNATIGGGWSNTIQADAGVATIGGGWQNWISANAQSTTISGGHGNWAQPNANHGAIGGGYLNIIQEAAESATIPGGQDNSAASFAFAAGYRAKANHQGSFVWGDSSASDMVSTTNNSVTFRASGGYRLFSSTNTTAPAPGVYLAAGDSSWSTISDRTAKKDFALVDGMALLERLARVPVQQWHYQWEETSVAPHIGPMAQDFKAAFYPGRDDKSISTLEFDGVALAAIQGLNEKVEVGSQRSEIRSQRLEARLEQKETEITELKQTVSELKDLVQAMNQKLNGGAQ